MATTVLCCFKGCLGFNSTIPKYSRENAIQLDTGYMGYEVVIVKDGQRVCGSGACLGNAPLVQSKSYFEVKIQQNGSWSIGLATRETNLNSTIGGIDQFSWTLNSDGTIKHNGEQLYQLQSSQVPQEGDIVGVTFDHIQLTFSLNGKSFDCPVTNVKGVVYPALYVDDGAILDIILDSFNFSVPAGFDRIMVEQSLL